MVAIAILNQGVSMAAPAPAPQSSSPSFRQLVQHLDANGQVTWTEADSGARTAHIPFDLLEEAKANKLNPRDDFDSGVSGWANMGQIANYAARYACQHSGEYALDSTVSASVTDACKGLVAMTPGTPVASKAWNIWQGAKAAANSEGQQVRSLFRFFYKSASAPKLDEVICKRAFDALTQFVCQGKGDKGTSSQGGEVRIGNDDNYIQIGFDPEHI
ncbi:MAG: hypothetical protein Q9201_005980 [Fulgogasparrea decipioides]